MFIYLGLMFIHCCRRSLCNSLRINSSDWSRHKCRQNV